MKIIKSIFTNVIYYVYQEETLYYYLIDKRKKFRKVVKMMFELIS